MAQSASSSDFPKQVNPKSSWWKLSLKDRKEGSERKTSRDPFGTALSPLRLKRRGLREVQGAKYIPHLLLPSHAHCCNTIRFPLALFQSLLHSTYVYKLVQMLDAWAEEVLSFPDSLSNGLYFNILIEIEKQLRDSSKIVFVVRRPGLRW
jgi:hypothetical protein